MTTRDTFGRDLSLWLREEGEHRVPDHLAEVLVRSAVTRQRPWWSSPERWLPMHNVASFCTRSQVVLAAADGSLCCSSRSPPQPCSSGAARTRHPSPASPGMAPWSTARMETSTGSIWRRAKQPRSSPDRRPTAPRCSRATDAASRSSDALGSRTRRLFIANADGTNPRQVAGPLVEQTWGEWSPDGSKFAIVSTVGTTKGITIANADGSGSHVLDVDSVADSASWLGPDGNELLVQRLGAGGRGLYVIRADGSAVPSLIAEGLPPDCERLPARRRVA